MKDILDGLTQEEIENLARKQLENSSFSDETLEIINIDKQYKEHNKKAVIRAVKSASVIFLSSWIVLNSNVDINDFGTEQLNNIFQTINNLASHLPFSDSLITVYSFLFDGISKIIDTLGLVGILIANKSIKFILSTIKDTKEALRLKNELHNLERKIEILNMNESNKTK